MFHNFNFAYKSYKFSIQLTIPIFEDQSISSAINANVIMGPAVETSSQLFSNH